VLMAPSCSALHAMRGDFHFPANASEPSFSCPLFSSYDTSIFAFHPIVILFYLRHVSSTMPKETVVLSASAAWACKPRPTWLTSLKYCTSRVLGFAVPAPPPHITPLTQT
jgi:hypothetical protein